MAICGLFNSASWNLGKVLSASGQEWSQKSDGDESPAFLSLWPLALISCFTTPWQDPPKHCPLSVSRSPVQSQLETFLIEAMMNGRKQKYLQPHLLIKSRSSRTTHTLNLDMYERGLFTGASTWIWELKTQIPTAPPSNAPPTSPSPTDLLYRKRPR